MSNIKFALAETFDDATTTITCLSAAVAGATSGALGSYAVSALNLNGSGLGGAGLSFCVRAAVSAACYNTVVRVVPDNVVSLPFFAILYFASDGQLVGSGVRIGTLLVNLVTRVFEPARVKPPAAANGSCCAGDSAKKCNECSSH